MFYGENAYCVNETSMKRQIAKQERFSMYSGRRE